MFIPLSRCITFEEAPEALAAAKSSFLTFLLLGCHFPYQANVLLAGKMASKIVVVKTSATSTDWNQGS